MHVSVVIPTYNRGSKLAATLDSILKSDAAGLESIEVIVVDDGSPHPAEEVVATCRAEPPFTLRCIRQQNAGPAAARNRGFRSSRGGIVLFIDDDILCPPNLIRQHVDAHAARPGSVICGRCPLVAGETGGPLLRFMNSLGNDPGEDAAEEFIEVPVVASGQLSVERSMFDAEGAVYRDDMATPAAEEFEISLRLRQRQIPILVATRLVAEHDHPVELESMCRQAYKHAKGCAEASLKCPEANTLAQLKELLLVNQPPRAGEPAGQRFKKALKHHLSKDPVLTTLMNVTRMLERISRSEGILAPLYRSLLALHMFAGVRQGFLEYGTTSHR